MAHGGPKQPEHGLTDILYHITPVEFGPLNCFKKEYAESFRSGSYFVTTPTSNMLTLYRLYGGKASEDGQFWTIEQRSGNEGYRHDFAVETMMKNTLKDQVIMFVPKGTILYEGPAAPQREYLGGGWQIFIPKTVVKTLLAFTKAVLKGNMPGGEMEKHMQRIIDAQEKLKTEYYRKYVENHLKNSKIDYMKKGNLLHRLPSEVKKAFSKVESGSYQSNGNLPTGTYKIHKEVIRFPNGQKVSMCYSQTVEVVSSSTRTYTVGRITTVETITQYRITGNWG